MKKNVVLITLLTVSFFLVACAPPTIFIKHVPEAGQKMKIAVLPFKSVQNFPESGEIATEAFSSNLLNLDVYDVIDRGALKQLLDEQNLGLTGVIEPSKALDIGKLAGADAIVIGAVTEFKPRCLLMFPPAKVALTARLINVKSGLVEWSAQYRVGGPKRWLTWVIPVIGVIATIISPSAEDQVNAATSGIVRSLGVQLKLQQ